MAHDKRTDKQRYKKQQGMTDSKRGSKAKEHDMQFAHTGRHFHVTVRNRATASKGGRSTYVNVNCSELYMISRRSSRSTLILYPPMEESI